MLARQYVHPASLASVTCCWAAARVPGAAADDLTRPPCRQGGHGGCRPCAHSRRGGSDCRAIA
eukprot:6509141-Alexandrium_andersonii.AAC.1